MFNQCPKTVHHAQYTYHRGGNYRYRCSADARNDIDGIMTFAGEEVSPSYMSFDI
jgi:hypothetical protein